ncbi:MAG: radical SAM protein [Firmicutes bacterium]|nr:radical SAM protein [Bacillota bacterium]
MKKHANIPVFIPHLGCPNNCVFCNQRSISGASSFDESKVKDEIEKALGSIDRETEAEIAYFGGSFTGIDRNLMIRLLETAEKYIQSGRVSSIRLSTRPDYIDKEILDILSRYGVKNIELGIQSMNDRVLALSKRGHTSADSERACRMIVEAGFGLVGQMMIGLPGSCAEDEIETAKRICALGASGARIYPTAVFAGTELDAMRQNGSYAPLGLEDAVVRACGALRVFRKNGVFVLRVGLCENAGLHGESGIAAGVYHPAFGELCESRLVSETIEKTLRCGGIDARGRLLTVRVPKNMMSKVIGQGGSERKRLIRELSLCGLRLKEGVPALIIGDAELPLRL